MSGLWDTSGGLSSGTQSPHPWLMAVTDQHGSVLSTLRCHLFQPSQPPSQSSRRRAGPLRATCSDVDISWWPLVQPRLDGRCLKPYSCVPFGHQLVIQSGGEMLQLSRGWPKSLSSDRKSISTQLLPSADHFGWAHLVRITCHGVGIQEPLSQTSDIRQRRNGLFSRLLSTHSSRHWAGCWGCRDEIGLVPNPGSRSEVEGVTNQWTKRWFVWRFVHEAKSRKRWDCFCFAPHWICSLPDTVSTQIPLHEYSLNRWILK